MAKPFDDWRWGYCKYCGFDVLMSKETLGPHSSWKGFCVGSACAPWPELRPLNEHPRTASMDKMFNKLVTEGKLS